MSGGLWGLCPVISKLEGEKESLTVISTSLLYLVSVVVSHDHVHHSLHEGLEHIRVEVLDWLDEWLESLTKPKSYNDKVVSHRHRHLQFSSLAFV